MKVIGITGGVGAGKSLIINYIKDNFSSEIIMADDLAKSLCKSGEVCFEPLINLLGEEALSKDKEIDRGKMASMIFNNDELRFKVNAIIHPAVKAYIKNRIEFLKRENTIDFLLLEAALLIEDGYKEIVDELWYIYCSEDIRRKRLKELRGYSDEKIDSIFSSQLSEEEFRNNTDFEIDNSGSIEVAYKKISERLREFL